MCTYLEVEYPSPIERVIYDPAQGRPYSEKGNQLCNHDNASSLPATKAEHDIPVALKDASMRTILSADIE